MSGEGNLFVHALLHGLSGAETFEESSSDRFPTMSITSRTVVLRTVKRVGWLLDERERAVSHVPARSPG
ncbi:hypothetical protein [Streptomyces arboris]|uniref:Uncharacterized protein n=1 Tax=Streptomyces arboris TaxID=2600619 RepID=A0A5N5ELZ9_9ACTN|nr:hypothetical protein [Streptomyces arboris]KAB2591875.1 hypothetical protein F5983_13665 [Streptomyces arboris]